MPRPFAVISYSASIRTAEAGTFGISLPLTMTSLTRSNSCRPSAPPGCEKANSSAVKPLASSTAMAKASPITSAAVVLAVGARFRGQASVLMAASRWTSDAPASSEVASPVMLMSVTLSLLISGNNVRISLVPPLLDSARTQSLRVIIPISP